MKKSKSRNTRTAKKKFARKVSSKQKKSLVHKAPQNAVQLQVKARKNTMKTTLGQIKTPTSVEEFRANLKKYFYGYGQDALYVKPIGGIAIGVPYEDLTSIDDLYKITGSLSLAISPLIDFDTNDVLKHMQATGQHFSSIGFFSDDYPVYSKENDWEVQQEIENPQWFSIDNQILCEFLVKVLGDFSGYTLDPVFDIAS
jgi:hypothetical protein